MTTRRSLIKAGTAALVSGALPIRRAKSFGEVIRIGHVSPQTGAQSNFAEGQDWSLDVIRQYLRNGLVIDGKTYRVDLITKDSQTSAARAAEVASDLILKDKVDIITASSGSITCNPVANQAELNEIPCITTDNPWQAYYYGRQAPRTGFDWTYHFFWGIDQVLASFIDLWQHNQTNKVVGLLFNTAQDDTVWHTAFVPAIRRAGFTLIDPGQFPAFGNDFTPLINAFKKANVEIISGNMYTSDFATFYAQCSQQGYKPKIITLGKAFLFPRDVAALGPRGIGVTSEVWWTPSHPFRSSLNGMSCRELAAAYEKATNRPWSQPIPFKHALFEVAIDVLKRSKDPKDAAANLVSLKATSLATIVGQVKWTGSPVKNVSTTPVVVGQWQKRELGLELAVVDDTSDPQIPVTSKLLPLA